MNINTMYKGISGEVGTVIPQGHPCIIVRTQKCNLKCSYCFGVKPGRRNPKIITSRIRNKKITDIQVGDRLMTFNSEMSLVETEVIETHTKEVDVWYEIKIGDYSRTYFVTPEHPFFTTNGLISADKLKVGDNILHSNPNDKIGFNKLGELSSESRREFKTRLKSTGRNGMEVLSIKKVDRNNPSKQWVPNPLKVYNLTCAPFNSYLIDYMWVHNCDSPETQAPATALTEQIDIQDIIDLAQFSNLPILLTGGEPLLQMKEVEKLCQECIKNQIPLQIETNGTISVDRIIGQCGLVIDYKFGEQFRINLYSLTRNDWVKFVVQNEEELEEAKEFIRFHHPTNCHFAISYVPGSISPQKVAEFLIINGLDAVLNVQIHKILGLS